VLDRFHELYKEAFAARRRAYTDALETLYGTSGWTDLKEAEQADVARRLRERSAEEPLGEPWRQAATILGSLRDQADAAKGLLDAAHEALRKLVTPQAVEINVRALLSGPISNQEELDAALTAIREEIEKTLADGKPVVLV
jgi:ABC-type transporter Mla subunit MlaD